jgi:hypothetical protein
MRQPQSLSDSTNQPPVDVRQKPHAFSKDMNYEELAMWLTNHPKFVGADYQQDIGKLRSTYIHVAVVIILC